MPRLYLVRHALPKLRNPGDTDPPLDPKGVAQAEAMARALAAPAPLPLYTSPLARCRMTAASLAARWHSEPQILNGVREVPAPGAEGSARAAFLGQLLQARWPEAFAWEGEALRRWHGNLVSAMTSLARDSVIVSHYVAINAIVGLATGSDRVAMFKPGHASVTIVDEDRGRFALVRLGAEAETQLTSG